MQNKIKENSIQIQAAKYYFFYRNTLINDLFIYMYQHLIMIITAKKISFINYITTSFSSIYVNAQKQEELSKVTNCLNE